MSVTQNYTQAHIIAEAGVNHNGKIKNAYRLIDIAKDSGSDSIKFQIINPYGLYLPGKYKFGHYDIEKVLKMRFETVFTDDEYQSIFEYADKLGIKCSASVFDIQGLDLLCSFGPPYIKIASTDLTNVKLLREIASRGIKMILSTGMSDLSEIEFSLNEITKEGMNDIVLLHCVSIYPASLAETNLSFITTLQKEFGYHVGFSDHTRTNEASIAAYMLGARWFEKHFTFDNDLEGFDHKHAQSIEEFKGYVSSIRNLELSLNSFHKISEAEKYTAERARRSLYAVKNIKAGNMLKVEDVLVVRPSNIMKANQIDEVIGKRLKNDISQFQPLNPIDFDN